MAVNALVAAPSPGPRHRLPEADVTAREPQEIAQAAATTGAKKTHRSWDRVLISAFLAGAYIAFGALVAITVSSGLDPATWGTLPTLFMGAAFTLGLVLVLIAGLVARRISRWVGPGDAVAAGERISLIHFGSRTDVLLPGGDVEVLVRPGDKVRAGRTPLARYRTTAP